MEQEQKTISAGRGGTTRAIFAAVAVCAVLTAGALALVVRAQRPANIIPTTAETKAERVLIAIEGMHCGGCASGIKAMLKRTSGVISAEVSFEEKQATVEFDPSATSREKILEAITNMGYKASVKS